MRRGDPPEHPNPHPVLHQAEETRNGGFEGSRGADAVRLNPPRTGVTCWAEQPEVRGVPVIWGGSIGPCREKRPLNAIIVLIEQNTTPPRWDRAPWDDTFPKGIDTAETPQKTLRTHVFNYSSLRVVLCFFSYNQHR